MEEFLTGPALARLIGGSRWKVYRLLQRDPTFPKPIKLAANSCLWIKSEVEAWLCAKIAERDADDERAKVAKRNGAQDERATIAARAATRAAARDGDR